MIEKVINGVNFKQISDVIYDQDQKDDLSNLPDKTIIWCKIDYVEAIFSACSSIIDRQYILVTHCGDREVSQELFNLKPKSIKKWFAQNVNAQHPDLIPLPIGIENHLAPHKGAYTDFEFFKKEAFDFEIKNKIINKVYCNFRGTHPSRWETANIIAQKNIGVFENNLSFTDYTNSMKRFLFVASPRGNGLDAHRTWEALYYGCIPIVEKHFSYDSYKNLPIIQIDNWNNLSLEMLTPYIEDYKNKKLFVNTEELTVEYWFNKIKNS
jgi:hypothetical protein